MAETIIAQPGEIPLPGPKRVSACFVYRKLFPPYASEPTRLISPNRMRDEPGKNVRAGRADFFRGLERQCFSSKKRTTPLLRDSAAKPRISAIFEKTPTHKPSYGDFNPNYDSKSIFCT
jgi:hypothetical protein